MDIILDSIDTCWHVVVHNHTNILHVKSSRGDIRSNQHSQCSVFKRLHDFGPFPLRPVTVQSIHRKPIIPQFVGKIVTTYFLSNENNNFGMRLSSSSNSTCFAGNPIFFGVSNKFLQDCFQFIEFVTFLTHNDFLHDISVCIQGIDIPNINLNWILQKVMCQPLDLLGPSRREEHCLTLFGNFFHNGSNLRLKTHVQHAICFVQDEVLDTREIGLFHFNQIVETTGASNNTFDTTFKGSNLRILGRSTITADATNAKRTAKFLSFL
mmetsp:Transcript_24280/g.45203  ORF Transcript_24280/g.45203 Transcript_24280/m.45203 type:complete len:266 (+) Transcript_24280:1527-2324(+)